MEMALVRGVNSSPTASVMSRVAYGGAGCALATAAGLWALTSNVFQGWALRSAFSR